MRFVPFTVLLLTLSFVSPVLAGTATYADMRGKWQSTGCTAPQALVAPAKNSEAAANDLNAQVTERNKFVTEAHDYMTCIAKEAQRDSDAMGLLVTQSAKVILDKTQADIDAALANTSEAKASMK